MPDEARPTAKVVQCKWCSGSVLRRQVNRHFQGDCPGLPPIPEGKKVCTACHEIRGINEFPKSKRKPGGKDYTCIPCHKQNMKIWNTANRPRRENPNLRPGRWVLRPCPDCGQEFNARQMVRHRPRCEKRPATGRDIQDSPAYLTGTADLSVDARGLADGNDARQKRRHKHQNLKNFYGITIEQYEEMVARQGGLCAICGSSPDNVNRRTSTLYVDHCHATGIIRGLLCHHCNIMLGASRDDTGNLEKGTAYLRLHQSAAVVS